MTQQTPKDQSNKDQNKKPGQQGFGKENTSERGNDMNKGNKPQGSNQNKPQQR